MENSFNINFTSSKDNNEEHVIHSKSDNLEIMINYKTDEVIEESLFSKYQIGLEISTKDIDFMFESIDSLYYKSHKSILKRIELIYTPVIPSTFCNTLNILAIR